MVVLFPPKSLSFQAVISFLGDHCEQDLTDEEPTPWPLFQGQTSSVDDIKTFHLFIICLSQFF